LLLEANNSAGLPPVREAGFILQHGQDTTKKQAENRIMRTSRVFDRQRASTGPTDVRVRVNPITGGSMYRSFRLLFAALLGVLLLPAASFAGWISLTNTTAHTVVVQESVTVNGQTRKCKPIKLAPGEIYREFQQGGGTKKLTLLEPGLLGKQLYTGDLTWKDDTSFSIHKDGDKTAITDVKALAVKAGAAANVKPAEKKPTEEKKP
jgi:hypothetical protein